MKIIVCISDDGGMRFHDRPQSRDRKLESVLAEQYEQEEYIRIEDRDPAEFAGKIEKIVVCRWNRSYPSDLKMTIDLETSEWELESVREIEGSSHENITIEEYRHA